MPINPDSMEGAAIITLFIRIKELELMVSGLLGWFPDVGIDPDWDDWGSLMRTNAASRTDSVKAMPKRSFPPPTMQVKLGSIISVSVPHSAWIVPKGRQSPPSAPELKR
jgi:hypothetical protein